MHHTAGRVWRRQGCRLRPGVSTSSKGIESLDDKYDASTGYFCSPSAATSETASCGRSCGCHEARLRNDEDKRYDERLRMRSSRSRRGTRSGNDVRARSGRRGPRRRDIFNQPSPRQKTIVEGRMFLEKYNCAGCHIVYMERGMLRSHESIDAPPTTNDYPFLRPDVTPDQIKTSVTTDRRGLLHANCTVCRREMRLRVQPRLVDADGVPIERMTKTHHGSSSSFRSSTQL